MITVSDGKMNLDNAWRPIETAPRDRLIDIWAEGRRATDCRFSNGRWVSWSHAVRGVPRWTILNNPTHWMPPPDAPA